MPANPTVGLNYYHEFAPLDGAVDQGRIVSVSEEVSVPVGNFSNVVQVLETTELDPEAREFKYYAPGLGLVLVEEGLDENFQNPDFAVPLIRVLPEPHALTLDFLVLSTVLLAFGIIRTPKGRSKEPALVLA